MYIIRSTTCFQYGNMDLFTDCNNINKIHILRYVMFTKKSSFILIYIYYRINYSWVMFIFTYT